MLKDIAKVLVGALITKMCFLIWLIAANMLPIQFLGLDWNFTPIMISILTEFIVAILLIYYAWIRKPKINYQENKESTKQKE
ncbi:MAG TPA: hypothetical protein P5096_00570 [Patescibacteria group bacterium]|nr:hypothetical protein [Patescibacteria group bacterium]